MAESASNSDEPKTDFETTEAHAAKTASAEASAPAGVKPISAQPPGDENKLANSKSDDEVPAPTKITVVRSQKSHSDLPAMQPPIATSVEQVTSVKVEDGTAAKVDENVATAVDQRTEAIDDKETAAKGIPVKSASTSEKSLIAASPTLAADQKFLTESLEKSREEMAANLEAQRQSRTKVSFPAPEQPLPPPQAPPQFLGDGNQEHTKPADASRDRSQFGAASQFSGAPIALLTNVSKHKNKKPAQLTPQSVFEFVKGNVVACALTLSMVILATLILNNNKESKSDPVKSLDLSFITTGQSLEEVNQLVAAKKFAEAQALCDRIIQKDPKYAEAYHSRGQVFMAMHRFREAVDDFTTAESYNHRSIDIHIDRAAALFHAQDYDKARHEYEDIILLDPNNAPAYFGKGLAEENLKDTKEALADFQKTLSLQPDYAAANEEIGTINFSKGDLAGAYEEYTKAIKLAPDVARFYFNRANSLKQDRQTAKAIADYCKAIQLDATSPEFFNNRGLLYLDNNETAKAITDFSSAVDLDPNYTMAKHNLTLAQERLRR